MKKEIIYFVMMKTDRLFNYENDISYYARCLREEGQFAESTVSFNHCYCRFFANWYELIKII